MSTKEKKMHNLRGSLDNMKGDIQLEKLQRLELHAIWDKSIFYRWLFDKVQWFYSTLKHLFKLIVRT